MKMMPQQYCLRWKHHHSNVQNMFAQLLEKERFCDVTLYCSPNFATQVPNMDTVHPQHIRGVSLRAHRVVLAACSELLGALLGAHEAQGEPVLVLDGAEPAHLRALLDYMYTGEMNVHHSQLASLLKTAEELRIKGLTDIRWNNKDEPPDCHAGLITTTTTVRKPSPERKSPELNSKNTHEPKNTHVPRNTHEPRNSHEPRNTHEPRTTYEPRHPFEPANAIDHISSELRAFMKKELEGSDSDGKLAEKFNVNGGPPPLIKLPIREKGSPVKRENSDSDTPSPKRQRLASGTEHTDDEDRDSEWQHGNLDISAERVVGWGMGESEGGDWSRDASDDEWADAPADIGSFLHTRLRVDGDNSADEDSDDSSPLARRPTSATASAAAAGVSAADIKVDMLHAPLLSKPTVGPKSGPTDPRFTDVVKLNDYLQHGRRPQFWEENYVKRVMESVRLKELEMKQAAEILGVSYGTLYGRYRDVYGCINRPYRTARDFWQAKGPSEVLERLQRGDISLDAASQALGVAPASLAAHVAELTSADKEFEPIPIEIDPSLKMKSRPLPSKKDRYRSPMPASDKASRRILVGSLDDEDTIPVTVITAPDGKGAGGVATTTSAGKWPSIRVASLDTLRADAPAAGAGAPVAPTSPSQLMRTRPDLTIVAAKKAARDEEAT